MNIVKLLCDSAQRNAARIAIIEHDQKITYDDLWRVIEKLSAAFYKIGIHENDRVALILPNSMEFICCFFALLKINAVVTPLNPNSTYFELKSVFHTLNPHAIITFGKIIDKIQNDEPLLLDGKLVVSHELPSKIGRHVRKIYELKRLYELEVHYKIGNIATEDIHAATINYTYRGWGHALGAVLSHRSYLHGSAMYVERTGINDDQRVLSLLPPYNIFPLMGNVFAPLLVGATIIVARNLLLSNIFYSLNKYRISVLLAVPSLYRLMLKHWMQYDVTPMKYCITGGDCIAENLLRELQYKFRAEILQGYGLTECLPVTCNPPGENILGSLGPAGIDVIIKVVDEYGDEKKRLEVGEIIIKSPTLMSAYYGMQEETNRVLKDGWFYTGDLGYIADNGYLYFAGCKKNISKVGGNTVDLNEVRNVLLSHPLISDARVYSVEDDLSGHVIEAGVTFHGNVGVTQNELRTYCSAFLSRYKIPKFSE